VSKVILFFTLVIFVTGCSFNKNSKFWTASQDIAKENNSDYTKIFVEEEALGKELNQDLKITLDGNINNNLSVRNYFNNDGRLDYDGLLEKSSRYKFSKSKLSSI